MIVENVRQDLANEDYLERCRALMQPAGWYTQAIMGAPAFCYSVGLADLGIGSTRDTELLVCGLDVQTMFGLLQAIVRKYGHEGRPLAAGMRLEGADLANVPLMLRAVSPQDVRHHMPLAQRLLGRQPRALQVLWPDANGLFPGDPGCEEPFISLQSLALLEVKGTLQ